MEKIILITGASRGIGAATALLAAERGYTVCVNYLNDKVAANKVVAQIEEKGGKAIAVRADVSVEVMKLFATIDQELGALTALVNNVGIIPAKSKIDEIDTVRLQKIFATNVFSQFYCCREAVRRMSTEKGGNGGAIVNISSMATVLGSANEYVDYAASKGAIDTLTRGLALEVAAEGIRVNAIQAGTICTEMHANSGDPDRVEKIKHKIPLHRGGEAIEIAYSVLWLLSAEASYTTGTSVNISGGL